MSRGECAKIVVYCMADSVQPEECECDYFEHNGSDSCKHLDFVMGDTHCHSEKAIKDLFK